MAQIRNGIISTELVSEDGTPAPTLQEMKDWLRMSYSTDDTLIENLIKTAIRHVESYCGIYVTEKQVKVVFTHDGEKSIFIPGPVLNLSTLKFRSCRNRDWTTVTTETDEWELEGNDFIGNWVGYYQATYTAGFADGEVPQGIQDAVKQIVTRWYENRGDNVKHQLTIEDYNILNSYTQRFWV